MLATLPTFLLEFVGLCLVAGGPGDDDPVIGTVVASFWG
jgi:hypothetical protein